MIRILTFMLLLSESVFAGSIRETRFMVDVGAGLPQLAGLDVAYRLFPSWQIGMGYGLIPGGQGISPGFSLPSQNVTLANEQFVTFSKPTIHTTLSSMCPFIRWYPNPSNFYVQFTLGLLQAKNDFESQILDISGNTITDAKYTGVITVTQMLPTLSMGRVFASDLFFFNVNMGVTIVATADVSTSLTSELPDRLGGNTGNQAQLDQVNENAKTSINSGLQVFRNEVLFLPSIQFTFGFMF